MYEQVQDVVIPESDHDEEVSPLKGTQQVDVGDEAEVAEEDRSAAVAEEDAEIPEEEQEVPIQEEDDMAPIVEEDG